MGGAGWLAGRLADFMGPTRNFTKNPKRINNQFRRILMLPWDPKQVVEPFLGPLQPPTPTQSVPKQQKTGEGGLLVLSLPTAKQHHNRQNLSEGRS